MSVNNINKSLPFALHLFLFYVRFRRISRDQDGKLWEVFGYYCALRTTYKVGCHSDSIWLMLSFVWMLLALAWLRWVNFLVGLPASGSDAFVHGQSWHTLIAPALGMLANCRIHPVK